MAWTQVVSLTGSQGPEGPEGPQGPQGAEGPQGPAGEGIAIAGSVATYAALPSDLTAGDAGDGYLVEADGLLYIWSGTSFPADGSGVAFQGPAGPAGPQGDIGPTGATGAAGAAGPAGSTGPAGPAGDDGLRGTQIYSGAGAPGTISGSAVGDFYID
ncbi:MAG TPA: hypothetical protein VGW74_20215, partial [Propionibacteriaceae bacterium]|nr:hypothetical protein [Propionibacteriaceae bacterium]